MKISNEVANADSQKLGSGTAKRGASLAGGFDPRPGPRTDKGAQRQKSQLGRSASDFAEERAPDFSRDAEKLSQPKPTAGAGKTPRRCGGSAEGEAGRRFDVADEDAGRQGPRRAIRGKEFFAAGAEAGGRSRRRARRGEAGGSPNAKAAEAHRPGESWGSSGIGASRNPADAEAPETGRAAPAEKSGTEGGEVVPAWSFPLRRDRDTI